MLWNLGLVQLRAPIHLSSARQNKMEKVSVTLQSYDYNFEQTGDYELGYLVKVGAVLRTKISDRRDTYMLEP